MKLAARLVGIVAVGILVGLVTTVQGQLRDPQAAIPRITVPELKKLITEGNVLIVDVRDALAYEAGHIPGAILIPLEDVARRASELKSEKRPIITYCS